jgi:phenylpropionate dioxygenase-like ring-hydroxylating dioxygenase large terminal subunit
LRYYDDKGPLTGVPHPGSALIDRASHGLDTVRLEVWREIVFINFDVGWRLFDHPLAKPWQSAIEPPLGRTQAGE